MEFEIKKINKSINDLMRSIGYHPAYFQKGGEFSMVRKLSGGEYPRFHLYIQEKKEKESFTNSIELVNEAKGKSYLFNLHLDQKKPSYEGAKGHSGDYHGIVVESEVQRIQKLLGA